MNEELGMFIVAKFVSQVKRPEKQGKGFDGYNLTISNDQKGETWRIKVMEPVVAQMGDLVRVGIDNINSYRDRVYLSGSVQMFGE